MIFKLIKSRVKWSLGEKKIPEDWIEISVIERIEGGNNFFLFHSFINAYTFCNDVQKDLCTNTKKFCAILKHDRIKGKKNEGKTINKTGKKKKKAQML